MIRIRNKKKASTTAKTTAERFFYIFIYTNRNICMYIYNTIYIIYI